MPDLRIPELEPQEGAVEQERVCKGVFRSWRRAEGPRRHLALFLVTLLVTGWVTLPGIWAAEFYVDAVAGEDTDPGTLAAPWKTLTRALDGATPDGSPNTGELSSGDIVHVRPGLYDTPTNGEAFPLPLVDGVEVLGDDQATVIVRPPSTDAAFAIDGSYALSGATRVSNLTLDGTSGPEALVQFDVATETLAPRLDTLLFDGAAGIASHGIRYSDVDTGNGTFIPMIQDSTFQDFDGPAVVHFQDDLFASGGTGNVLSPVFTGNAFSGNGYAFRTVFSGSPVVEGAIAPRFEDNTISSNDNGGLYFDQGFGQAQGQSLAVSPQVIGNTFANNSGSGVLLTTPGTVQSLTQAPIIQGNTFRSSGFEVVDLEVPFGSSPIQNATVDYRVLDNVIENGQGNGIAINLNQTNIVNLAADVLVAGNQISGGGSHGIFLTAGQGQSLDVDVMLTGNTLSSLGGDGAHIELSPGFTGSPSGPLGVSVQGNSISGAAGAGIDFLLRNSGGNTTNSLDLDLLVEGNVGNGGQYGLVVEGQQDPRFGGGYQMTVADNLLENATTNGMFFLETGGGQGGVEVAAATAPIRSGAGAEPLALVTCNTVSGATEAGVLVSFTESVTDAVPPDFGGGARSGPGLNTFDGNGTGGSGLEFDNQVPSSIAATTFAQSNFWGATDSATIDDEIFDDDEDDTLGEVDFSSFLTAAPAIATSGSPTLVDSLVSDVAPAGPSVGDTFEYTATVTMGGSCGCAAATFVPDVPANATLGAVTPSQGAVTNAAGEVALGSLGAGDTITVTYELTAESGCSLQTFGTFSCSQLGSLTTNTVESEFQTDLAITKTDGQATATAGDPITYTIQVANAGGCPATGANVTDTFPTAVQSPTWTCAAGASSTCTGAGAGDIDDTVDVASGESVTYTVDGTIDPAFSGTLSNTADVSLAVDSNPANDSATDTTEVAQPLAPTDVTGTKTVSGDFSEGGAITFTVTLTNQGGTDQQDLAGDEFEDVLPPEVTLVAASADSGVATANVGTNTVTWNGSIAAGGSVVITIDAVIDPGTTGETVANQGTIFFDANGDPGDGNEATAVTDDPSTPAADDPTTFQVGAQSVLEIPTLGEWARLLLALLLLVAGWAALRRDPLLRA